MLGDDRRIRQSGMKLSMKYQNHLCNVCGVGDQSEEWKTSVDGSDVGLLRI